MVGDRVPAIRVQRHRRVLGRVTVTVLAGIVAVVGACSDINTDPKVVASISLDSTATPSIVAGDTLRDSLGIVRPLHATAYNLAGDVLTSIPIRYHSPERHVSVDSVTGIVTADSVRPTPVRLVAEAGGLQTVPDSVYVVPIPDTVVATNARDSLLYSLTDTTLDVSNALTVRVLHHTAATTLDPVQGYLVSYAIRYPTDTLLAQLVGNDPTRGSRVAATGTDGSAGRRVKIRPIRIVATNDSVVVLATVRYRGALIAGAPLTFILQVKPHP